jgi:glucosamine 6-phosphate synthetase-like amidotransferase/phosphosugar isomerase protein
VDSDVKATTFRTGSSPFVVRFASDEVTLVAQTRQIVRLEDNDICLVDACENSISITQFIPKETFDFNGRRPLSRMVTLSKMQEYDAGKGKYSSCLENEIHEQPISLAMTIGSRITIEDEVEMIEIRVRLSLRLTFH